MKEYSERQLLLLSNLVYLPCSVTDKTINEILNDYRDSDGSFSVSSVSAAGTGGGLSCEDICTLFEEFDDEIRQNPEFGNLSATRTLNDGYVRALCYTDENDENPVVAYRGTGGTQEAWVDNFEGGFQTDTKMQQLAADFMKYECANYTDITVTGHSKGGNMSQYATVMCSGQVSKCISFDGQGFNKDFIEENEDKVREASPKIKSVAAYNDYVNILLTPIAGTILYVENDNTIAAAHSSLSLLANNEYDEFGNFTSGKSQAVTVKGLKGITDSLVEKLSDLSAKDQDVISYITGSTVATALSINDLSDAQATMAQLMEKVSTALVDKMSDTGFLKLEDCKLSTTYLYMDTDSVLRCSHMLYDSISDIRYIRQRIDFIQNNLAFNVASKIYVKNKLERMIDDIEKVICSIRLYTSTIDEVVSRYESRETQIREMIG